MKQKLDTILQNCNSELKRARTMDIDDFMM